MQLKVYTKQGQEASKLEVADAVFGVKIKPALVHEVFVAQTNNQREPWAATKTRGDVRGGGKKPWKQKGTGRARHGSTRSPIWVGGGVTMGPKADRSYKSKINKTARRLATKMCLSDKVKNEAFYVIDQFDFAAPKTKLFVALIKALPTNKHSFLILTDGKDENVIRQTKNLPKITTVRAEDVSVMDLVKKQVVVASVDAVKRLEKLFVK
ncbi:MAG: 50S ribosomal protein L4 [Candidatus Magasanikbacteria bacterium]|nr:50S ribosomal protein L4 [Candidatus Magasanikbacteria bacterium]